MDILAKKWCQFNLTFWSKIFFSSTIAEKYSDVDCVATLWYRLNTCHYLSYIYVDTHIYKLYIEISIVEIHRNVLIKLYSIVLSANWYQATHLILNGISCMNRQIQHAFFDWLRKMFSLRSQICRIFGRLDREIINCKVHDFEAQSM